MAYQREFSPQRAARLRRRYQESGAQQTTRILAQALERGGVQGLTLLDVGGGIGALQHALLEAGVERATSVDASRAFIELAEEEARERGLAARIEFRFGDFVALAAELPDADIVTLDRVICCYHDMPGLVGLSAARAARYYGAVYPRDKWWVRLWNWAENCVHLVQRSGFRSYIYVPRDIDACLRENGLRECFRDQTLAWYVVVYERKP